MRKVIKRDLVRVDDTPAAMPGSVEATESANCQPELRVIRAEGRVAAIEYTCSCGERAHFELEYRSLEELSSATTASETESSDLPEEPAPPEQAA